jgi:lysophospholipase L1-like esterase
LVRLVCSLFVAALICAWVGCSSSDDNAGAPHLGKGDASTDGAKVSDDAGGPLPEAAPPVELKPFQIVGRYDTRDDAGARISWAGTQIVAQFTGDSVTVDLSDTTGDDQYEWSVDGSDPTLFKVDKDKKTYPLASGLSASDHTLVLTKRTESSVGESQIFAITAKSLPGTAPPFTRRIEMVGDSITAGYGVLGKDATCTFSPDTEDESFAWGALAAKQLNAMHSAIAWSGIGITTDYDGDTTDIMPNRYDRALGTDETSKWSPALFPPDAIVVALGTNDLDGNGPDPTATFQTKLTAFLATIRTANPNAQIILASSPLLTDPHRQTQIDWMNGAMAARKTAGDTKISFLEIAQVTDAEGFGCDSHPSKATQARMASSLVGHIKPLLNW